VSPLTLWYGVPRLGNHDTLRAVPAAHPTPLPQAPWSARSCFNSPLTIQTLA
jgi:hypothetical protein